MLSIRSAVALRVTALAACVAALAACARLERFSVDVASSFRAYLVRPIQYRMAGVDPALRRNLAEGLRRVEAGEPRAAIDALNRAIWDVERLDDRGLRLVELADIHHGLVRAYAALGRPAWAEEQRVLRDRIWLAGQREAAGTWVQAMERARSAFVGARFREAVSAWHDALADLQDVADARTRVKQGELARCYLALTHFALGDEARVREELRRLAALDPSVATCRRHAPPAVRAMIAELSHVRRAGF